LKRIFNVVFAAVLVLALGRSAANSRAATEASKPAPSFNSVFSSVMFGNSLYGVRGT
jgi:hypothetical protein